MRISPDTSAQLVASLARAQYEQEIALQQMSSGRRISVPSDDPDGMSRWIQTRSQIARNDQFVQNVAGIKALYHTADSTLSSVVLAMNRAISLGVRGANGTNSQPDRDAVAQEIRGIEDDILTLANVSFAGGYVFSGTATRTQPFRKDSATSEIVYDANSGVVEASIGENQSVPLNVPGNELFMAPGASVFQSLHNLASALESGDEDAIASATSAVRAAFDHLSAKRVFYGNAIQQLEAHVISLGAEKIQLASQENDIAGVDSAEAITRLLNAETARETMLKAAGTISRLSLLDFLR